MSSIEDLTQKDFQIIANFQRRENGLAAMSVRDYKMIRDLQRKGHFPSSSLNELPTLKAIYNRYGSYNNFVMAELTKYGASAFPIGFDVRFSALKWALYEELQGEYCTYGEYVPLDNMFDYSPANELLYNIAQWKSYVQKLEDTTYCLNIGWAEVNYLLSH